ncbi:MAG TPA: ACT domain-containing protein [Acidimicrobiia bacterium]|nr:ACT domain-containing protein [Acidimicrobiia bacterium]
MSGETDLDTLLGGLSVSRRPGTFTFVTVEGPVAADEGVHAVIVEDEGTTLIATIEAAQDRGWQVGFEGAWLTLDVHSSLTAVGLTAAVSAALTAEGIPCNVVAGYHHDHLLVPVERAEDAIRRLEELGHARQ